MSKIEKLQQVLLECGVTRAAALEQNDLVLNAVFRDTCAQNGCGCYGKCYMCPPDVGPIDELMECLRQYPHGVLYQNVYSIEDSFDFEGMIEAKASHHANAAKIQEAIKAQVFSANDAFLHLEAGGCGVCKRCAKIDNLPCRFPEKALASLEAYGVDVYQTALRAGLPYINGQNTVTYFGVVMFKENGNA